MTQKKWSVIAIGWMVCMFSGCVEQSGTNRPVATFSTEDEELKYYEQAIREKHRKQTTIVAPWATQLTRAQAKNVDIVEGGLVMPESEVTRRLAKKDIVFAPHHDIGKAFLQRIESIERRDGKVFLKTRPAAVTEVVFKGSMSDAPTEANPYVQQEEMRTQGQELGISNLFPTISSGDINHEDGAFNVYPGLSGRFYADISPPRFQANANFDMEARISSSWYLNVPFFGQRVGVGGSPATRNQPRYNGVRTYCSSTIDGLEFIKGRQPDQVACRSAYEAWIDSEIYPQIPASVCHRANVECDTSDGAPRLRCRDERNFLPAALEPWVTVPYPEQADWAKDECRGTLEYFNLDAGINPTVHLDRFRLGLEGGYSQDALPDDAESERKDVPNLVKKQWKVSFFGWFPVAMLFEGKVFHNGWTFNAKGQIEYGFDNLEIDLGGVDVNLNFDGGHLESEHAWHGRLTPRTPSLDADLVWDGTIEGSFEREFVGVELGLYFYDFAGPYIIPAALYGRVTGAASTNPNTCNLGLASGVKGEFGIKGKVPLTNIESTWKLWEYDTCGSSPGTSLDYYQEDTSVCLKYCANTVPLDIMLEWTDAQDLDLIVALPTGEEISYATMRALGSYNGRFNNNDSCPHNQCNTTGDWKEFLRFYDRETLPQGTYRIKVRNHGDSSANFTIKVTGEDGRQREYLSENFSGSAPGNRGESQTFTVNVRTPMD